MKSTLLSTEVHVYLWPLLDVDVGRVREPLVQKKKSIFKGGKERERQRGDRVLPLKIFLDCIKCAC